MPSGAIAPPPLSSTRQATAVSGAPETAAVNGTVPPGRTVTAEGLIVMATGSSFPPPPEDPPPPQPARRKERAKMIKRGRAFRFSKTDMVKNFSPVLYHSAIYMPASTYSLPAMEERTEWTSFNQII